MEQSRVSRGTSISVEFFLSIGSCAVQDEFEVGGSSAVRLDGNSNSLVSRNSPPGAGSQSSSVI